MSLLSHSFSTPSQCVPLRVDFVYITLFYGKELVLCDNDARPTNSAVQLKGILIVSGSIKGVTVKELMSFFSYFQVC